MANRFHITREIHDACIATRRALKAANPVLAEKAFTLGTFMPLGSDVSELRLDLDALDAVATAFATGLRPSSAQAARAKRILSRRAVASGYSV